MKTVTPARIFWAALIMIAVGVFGYWVTGRGESPAEQTYFEQMHRYGANDDQAAKGIAVGLCSADSVYQAKVMLTQVAYMPQVQQHPEVAASWVAVAATYGVEAYCPENRGIALQAMHELATGSAP